MSNTADPLRYSQKIRRLLLGAGLDGIPQHKLNQQTRTRIYSADDLRRILLDWESKRWVQRFIVQDFSKRPVTLWRATELLRNEWPQVTFHGELPVAAEDSEVS